MELSPSQKLSMYEKGFVRIPGVVPRILVNEALRAINHSLGEGMPAEDMQRLRSQSYCNEVQKKPCITDLFNGTPLHSLAESLLGKGKLNPVGGGQIALRFPSYSNEPAPKLHPHIDGTYSEHNGVPKGRQLNFTMLAAILLSDLPEIYSGNFTVWPGAHRPVAEYLREHGIETMMTGMPKIQMPDPLQITGQAGDIVLAHYLLPHTAAINLSPNVRYAIFFRLTVNDRPPENMAGAQRPEAILDPWLEWPGLQELTAKDRKSQPELALKA